MVNEVFYLANISCVQCLCKSII